MALVGPPQAVFRQPRFGARGGPVPQRVQGAPGRVNLGGRKAAFAGPTKAGLRRPSSGGLGTAAHLSLIHI
eukprot:10924968-Alexandrium_andersonii.AAC.1